MKRSHVATAAMVNDNGSNRNSEAALAVAGYSPPLDVNGNGNGNGKPPKKRIIDSVIAVEDPCYKKQKNDLERKTATRVMYSSKKQTDMKEPQLFKSNDRLSATSSHPHGKPRSKRSPLLEVVVGVKGNRGRLPDKLFEILSNEKAPESLYWQTGGECFAVDVEKVQSELLDTYFDGTKIASFTRSLNRWGFNRICYSVLPKHILCYQHSMFKRARPELCTEMNLRPRGKNHNKTARIKPQPPSPAAAAADNARSSPVKSSASAPAYEASSSTLQLPQTAASTARTLPPASTPAATSSTTTDPRQTMSSGAQNPDLRTSVSLQSLLPYHVQGPIVLSLNHFDLHNLIAQVTNPRSTAASNSNTVLLEGEAIRQTHTNNNSKATSQGVGVGASKEKQQWQYLQQQQMMQQLLLTASVLNQPTSSLQQGGVRCNHDHAVRSGNDRNHNHNYNPKIYPDKSFSGSSSRNI